MKVLLLLVAVFFICITAVPWGFCWDWDPIRWMLNRERQFLPQRALSESRRSRQRWEGVGKGEMRCWKSQRKPPCDLQLFGADPV